MYRLLLILLFSNTYLYSIVSIEPVELNEKKGLSGEVDFAYKQSSGNTQRMDQSRGIKLQYDYKNGADFIINNYAFAKANGVKIEEKSFTHFRHFGKLDRISVWELYAQRETDRFKNLNLRQLAGTGLRFRFFNSEVLKLYFGVGIYASSEEYEFGDGRLKKENINRGNGYISYKHKSKDKFEATATIYYQPAISGMSDYFLLADGNIKLFLTKKLATKISFGAKEDSNPFEGNKKYDSYYIFGVGYKF